MKRIELKKFHEKRIRLRVVGKLGCISANKACLEEVKITRCKRKQKCIVEYDHLWIARGEALDNYDSENNIVSFNCFISKYKRVDGSEDFTVIEALKFKRYKDKTVYLKSK